MKQYKVLCLKCGGSNVVAIDEKSRAIYWKLCDRIISGRYRLDNQWGWQCICENNDLMTKQEEDFITDKQNPNPREIAQILKDIQPDKPKFRMEAV